MAISMSGGAETPMSDINTTPLVDVMLVLLIIFLIAVPVDIQTIEKLEIPVMVSVESKDKVENLLLTISTTDASGRSAESLGLSASRFGQCRVYFNNITPVSSEELYDQAFQRLDAIVQRAGGAAACGGPRCNTTGSHRGISMLHGNASLGQSITFKLPGYPTVGFISNPIDPAL